MIEVVELRKRYGRLMALDGVSFGAARGEVVGFLGPNGAGKTTTLRIVAGALAADGGTARIDGVDVAARPLEAQRRLGYLPEGAPLPGELRVEEYLTHRARLKDVPRRRAAARVDGALVRVGLGEVRRRPIGQLSRGQRQRVGLADVLLADPPALLLDEPTAGLDPHQLGDVRALLAELAAEGRTVVLSSHVLPEVAAVATRVVVLVGGRVAGERRLGGDAGRGGARVRVRPDDLARAAAALGATADPPVVLDAGEGRLHAAVPPDEAARRLAAAGVALLELGPGGAGLEELFASLAPPGGRPEGQP